MTEEQVTRIRERHDVQERTGRVYGPQAHEDRGLLLDHLDGCRDELKRLQQVDFQMVLLQTALDESMRIGIDPTTADGVKARKRIRAGEARRLRLELGLSLKFVADSILVHATSLSKWERGVGNPKLQAAAKLMRFFDTLDAL